MSDYTGAALMLPAIPNAKQLLADKGCQIASKRDPLSRPIPTLGA